MNANLSRTVLPVFSTLALSLCVFADIRAQESNANLPVMDRDRPAVDAQGIRLGSFVLYPLVKLTGVSNDNILADDELPLDDTIVQIAPDISLTSNWSRHSLSFGASADIASYSDYDSEDYEDSRIWASSRIDGRSTVAFVNLSGANRHEDRTSPNDRRGIEPTTYTENSIDGSVRFQPNRFAIRGGLDMGTLEFDDVLGIGGIIDNTDQDRDQRQFDLRLGYQVRPGLDLFMEGRRFETNYDLEFDTDGFQRSSDGQALVAGAELDITGRVFGEFYFGYREHEYDDPRFGVSDGSTFGVDLTWNATALTTIIVSADRRIDPTTIVGASEIEVSEFGLIVDHELLRNLLISIDLNIVDEEFNGVDRTDDIVKAGLTVRYLMNRKLHLHTGYSYDERESSGIDSGRQFTRNTVFLSLIGQI